MRVVLICENFSAAGGGNERSSRQIAASLAHRGHEVEVLAAAGDPLEGVEVDVYRGPPLQSGRGLEHFRSWAGRRLSARGPAVTLSMTSAVAADAVELRSGCVPESVARNLARVRGGVPRFLKRLAGSLRLKRYVQLALERRTLFDPAVRRLIALSRYVEDQLRVHYGIEGERVVRIPNGAEAALLPPEERQRVRRALRGRWGIGEGHAVFLFAAMNPYLKGFRELLVAFGRLRRRRPQVFLAAAGRIPRGARRLARRSGVDYHAVEWLGPRRDMDALYAAADVTVLPSWYDPASKVVLESLLHGVPAVSTLYNGASEWIYSPSGMHAPPSVFAAEKPRGIVRGPEEPAGRVIADPAELQALELALDELCDPSARRAAAEATRIAAREVRMENHVVKLEALLGVLAEAGDRNHAGSR